MGKIDFNSILGAGSGLLSGVGNVISQGMANSKNMALQKQQQAYNTQMWNMQNAYNDPSAQMARTDSAGINPYQALGTSGVSITSGDNSSPAQGVAPAQVQSTHIGNVFLGALEGFLNAMTSQSQSIKAVADASQAKASADQITALTPAQLGLTKAQTKQSVATEGELQSRAGLNNAQEGLVKDQDTLLAFERSLRYKYGDKLDQAQLDNITQSTKESAEHVNLMVDQGKLTRAQAVAALASAVESYAAAHHLNVDADQISAMTEPLVKSTNAKTNLLNWTGKSAQKDYNNYWKIKALDFGKGAFSTAVGGLIPFLK